MGKKGSDWDVFHLVTSGIPRQRYRASAEYSCPMRMPWSCSPPCPTPPAPAGSSFRCFSKYRRNRSPQGPPSTILHGESPLGPQDIAQRLPPPWTLLHSLNRTVFVYTSAALVAQTIKRLPALWESQVRALGREYPLEQEMATHSIILAWNISWTEEPGGPQSMGLESVRHD